MPKILRSQRYRHESERCIHHEVSQFRESVYQEFSEVREIYSPRDLRGQKDVFTMGSQNSEAFNMRSRNSERCIQLKVSDRREMHLPRGLRTLRCILTRRSQNLEMNSPRGLRTQRCTHHEVSKSGDEFTTWSQNLEVYSPRGLTLMRMVCGCNCMASDPSLSNPSVTALS